MTKGKKEHEGMKAADVLVFGSGASTRVVARASGTEPKLKLYLQVMLAVEHEVSDTQRRAEQRLSELARELRGVLER